MLNKLINTLEKINKYTNVEDKCFYGLNFLACKEILKNYMFLTPTHKNLELIKTFEEVFPEIQLIKEYKKNERFYLHDVVNMLSHSTVQEVIDYMKDRSIIIVLDEGYKIFEETMNVTKELAGTRRQPLRRNGIFKDNQLASKKLEHFNDWFQKAIIKLDSRIEVGNLWYNVHSQDLSGIIYVKLNLNEWTQTTLDVIYNDADIRLFDKLLRAKRKELKELLSNHIVFHDAEHYFHSNRFSREYRKYQISIPAVDYDEKADKINYDKLASKHSFYLSEAHYKENHNTILFTLILQRVNLIEFFNDTLKLIDELDIL